MFRLGPKIKDQSAGPIKRKTHRVGTKAQERLRREKKKDHRWEPKGIILHEQDPKRSYSRHDSGREFLNPGLGQP